MLFLCEVFMVHFLVFNLYDIIMIFKVKAHQDSEKILSRAIKE